MRIVVTQPAQLLIAGAENDRANKPVAIVRDQQSQENYRVNQQKVK
jgi:hypothetical protein